MTLALNLAGGFITLGAASVLALVAVRTWNCTMHPVDAVIAAIWCLAAGFVLALTWRLAQLIVAGLWLAVSASCLRIAIVQRRLDRRLDRQHGRQAGDRPPSP